MDLFSKNILSRNLTFNNGVILLYFLVYSEGENEDKEGYDYYSESSKKSIVPNSKENNI